MVKEILLSLIIPVWNTPTVFLQQCFAPFLQNRNLKIEIIIVDDGSCPETSKYLDSINLAYEAQVIHQKNQGQNSARCTGLSVARGIYVGFLDSDDFINWDSFAKIVDLLCDEDSDIIVFNGVKVDAKGKRIDSKELNFANFSKREYVRSCAELWRQFIRREFLEENGGLYNPSKMCIGEDLASILPLSVRADSIKYFNEDVYMYRQQRRSAIHSMDSSNRLSIIDSFNHIIKSLTNDELSLYHNEIEWQAVNHLMNYETRAQLRYGIQGLRNVRRISSWMSMHFREWQCNPYINDEKSKRGVAFRLSVGRKYWIIMFYQSFIRRILERGNLD
ncbi:glycosyl transferase [Bifidobacterium sp. DSM 109960]|uniref:Glycosyl transferase n=2 Tax=Bifidobacterium erythrocebi TaxID=2675325 RepID=A0A7Y0HW10_9BIFI|nr:glycosyl transferase [Bifidobacterium sp. DSM 109960]